MLNPTTRSMERRSTRSDAPDMALHMFLHERARQQHVAALMVSDDGGRLLATSRAIPELEELAALVPKLATRDPEGMSLADQLGIPIYFRRVQVGKQKLFVGAIGEESRCRVALPEVDRGVRRILGEAT
jgi:hypothetical protein